MLKRRGVEAGMALPPDFDDRFQKGQFDRRDLRPWRRDQRALCDTLRLYQGASRSRCPARIRRISRAGRTPNTTSWSTKPTSPTPDDTAKLTDCLARAMEIWLPELPDIQLVQNYHRIPMEHHVLEELADRARTPTSTARHWHLTFAMVLWNLQPLVRLGAA